MFGQTYGKTSYASSAQAFPRGIDQSADVKYKSMFKQEYIEHSKITHDTTAKIVGVHRDEDRFQRVGFIFNFYSPFPLKPSISSTELIQVRQTKLCRDSN